jgi:hypothetical protein
VRKTRAVRLNSSNGELHYISEESPADYASARSQELNTAELRRITMKEASKNLYLLRKE